MNTQHNNNFSLRVTVFAAAFGIVSRRRHDLCHFPIHKQLDLRCDNAECVLIATPLLISITFCKRAEPKEKAEMRLSCCLQIKFPSRRFHCIVQSSRNSATQFNYFRSLTYQKLDETGKMRFVDCASLTKGATKKVHNFHLADETFPYSD